MTHISPAHAPDRWSRVIDRIRARALTLTREFSHDVAPYDALPHSLRDADFLPAAQRNVELFFRYATEDIEPSESDTRLLVDRALRLVRDGMPPAEVLANYRVGATFFWAQLVPLLARDEYPVLPELGLRLTNYLSLVLARIATALVDDARQPRWEQLEQRAEIAAALLAGRAPSGWAQDSGIPIADAFLVTVLRLGDPAPGVLTGLRTRILALPGAFLHRDAEGWTALVPLRPADAADPAQALRIQLALPGDQPHPQFWIGVTLAATHAAIPDAYAEARIVAQTARRLDRPEIVCRRKDMLFEYAIATTGAALPNLAAVLDPLDEQQLLLPTLDAYIDNQFNHNATARTLYVHRNTVTYRLSRIADLTGYDPQEPTGISTLMAARVARQLTRSAARG